MAFLVWEPSFSVGIWEIDRQHRLLIGLINQLHEAVLGADPEKNPQAIFSAMVECLRNHFRFEEAYLERLGYKDIGVELASHRELLDQLAHMRQLFDAGPLTVSPEPVNFLKEWVTTHILQCNQGYAQLAAMRNPGLLITAAANEF